MAQSDQPKAWGRGPSIPSAQLRAPSSCRSLEIQRWFASDRLTEPECGARFDGSGQRAPDGTGGHLRGVTGEDGEEPDLPGPRRVWQRGRSEVFIYNQWEGCPA
jgi:hypothetical protein